MSDNVDIPANLDGWLEDMRGPVVLVITPRTGVGGQSSIVHMTQQPFAVFFNSGDAARAYCKQHAERLKRVKRVDLYPVIKPCLEDQ